MNRISMLLKFSDIMAVCRAVFAAGASRIVITTLPRQAWIVSLQDWYFGKQVSWVEATVKINVEVDKCHADSVVSAFLITASCGKIEKITQFARKTKGFSLHILKAA